MDTRSRHLLLEYYGCRAPLDAPASIERMLRDAAEAAGATVVKVVLHQYAPQGVSGVVVIEESHLSIHTWPESDYAAADVYTCGDCTPQRAHEVLKAALRPARSEVMWLERGLAGDRSIAVREHRVETEPRDETEPSGETEHRVETEPRDETL